jgi:hypothetical protein
VSFARTDASRQQNRITLLQELGKHHAQPGRRSFIRQKKSEGGKWHGASFTRDPDRRKREDR